MARPSAGVDATLTVPGGHVYHVRSVYGTLTTDATPGDRSVELRATVDGVVVGGYPGLDAHPESTTLGYTWAPGLNQAVLPLAVAEPMPPIVLMPGSILATLTGSIQTGDQWSAVGVLVDDEWISAGPVDLDRLDVEIVGTLSPGS